jgi:hypothetical protein
MLDCSRYIHKKFSAIVRAFWFILPLVLVLLIMSRISLNQLPGLLASINF